MVLCKTTLGSSTANSSCFKGQLNPRLAEAIAIPDVSAEALQDILHFFYTNEIKDCKTPVKSLLAAAHNFEYSDLKQACEDAIMKELSLGGDAREAFNIAHRFNCSSGLKKQAFRMIQE